MKDVSTNSLSDLVQAVKELDYAQSVLVAKQFELNAKRSAIKSFEDDEAKAHGSVERLKTKVKSIASNLEK